MAEKPLGAGEQAPGFELPSSTGESISLEAYRGLQGVVLFFYPKADTPG